MKKKTKLLIALLLVFVGVGLTYAVYTTSVGGNANVETANWVIKVKVNNTETDVSNGSNNVSLGSCQKLAPGGSCTLPFRVDATDTEVDTILTVELGSNVTGATLAELEAAGINLRISDGINEDYAYLLNMGQYKDLNLVINWEAGDEDDDEKAAADVNIAENISSITIPVNMIVKQRLGGLRTVTFNTHDNNIETPEPIQVNDGNSISEANIPVLVKSGYMFDGWYTSEVGGMKLTSSTIIIDNIEYHARFIESVTITFNSNGGTNVESQTIAKGTKLSKLPISLKNGEEFTGWVNNNTELTTNTTINSDITYTARFETPVYTGAGTEVYYDPVSGNECQSSFSVSNVRYDGSTCYRWRKISETSKNVTLQLDHDLANIAWDNSDNTGRSGPRDLMRKFRDLTKNWTNTPALNFIYDTTASNRSYGVMTCIEGVCTIKTTTIGSESEQVKARAITAEEIAALTKTKTSDTSARVYNWSQSNSINFYFSNSNYIVGTTTSTSGDGNTDLSWLVENMVSYSSSHSGSTNSVYSSSPASRYWTLTSAHASYPAYVIDYDGILTFMDTTNNFGARPVITIPKSYLN